MHQTESNPIKSVCLLIVPLLTLTLASCGKEKEEGKEQVSETLESTGQAKQTTSNMTERASETLSEAGQAVSETAGEALEKSEGMATTLADKARQAKQSATEELSEMGETAKSAVQAGAESVAGAAGSMAEKAESAADSAVETATQAKDQVAAGVANLGQSAESAAQSATQRTANAVGDLADKSKAAASTVKDLAAAEMGKLSGAAEPALAGSKTAAALAKALEAGTLAPGQEQLAERITFASGSAQVSSGDSKRLDAVAEILKQHQGLKIKVIGHSDSSGDQALNQKLSKDRAQAVKDLLVDKGVAEQRIQVHAVGSTQPVASNEIASGKSQNRRVDIFVVK